MLDRIRPRLSYANVISTIALFAVVGGGVAWAQGKVRTQDIRARAVTSPKIASQAVKGGKIQSQAVKGGKIRPDAVKTAKIQDEAVTLPKLAPAARNERLFAVVNEDGTLARGTAVDSEIAATGIYDVAFNRDVRECAYVATVGTAGASLGEPGAAMVNRDPTDPNGVRVTTFTSLASPLDTTPRPFHLQVDC